MLSSQVSACGSSKTKSWRLREGSDNGLVPRPLWTVLRLTFEPAQTGRPGLYGTRGKDLRGNNVCEKAGSNPGHRDKHGPGLEQNVFEVFHCVWSARPGDVLLVDFVYFDGYSGDYRKQWRRVGRKLEVLGQIGRTDPERFAVEISVPHTLQQWVGQPAFHESQLIRSCDFFVSAVGDVSAYDRYAMNLLTCLEPRLKDVISVLADPGGYCEQLKSQYVNYAGVERAIGNGTDLLRVVSEA